MEDMKILSVTPALEVNFHCFGESRDSDRIRGALNRLVQRRRLGEFFLEPSHFTFQQKPALQLQSLKINQINEHRIQLDDQFTLSCIAVGSSDLTFSWFKDDMLVNMSKATREIWYRHLPNDGSDYHTSVLTVDKATRLDEGVYTCQVLDWGVQQCASLRLGLRPDPLVKVVPMSSTVEKGATARLTCTTPNLRSVGIGFGWTKNRALLRLRPGQEVWEDLYPAGSILTVSSARQSAVYTCALARRSASARLEVVERGRVPLCPGEARWGLAWPETAPGARALLGCPRGFLGERAERRCRMRDAESSEWDLPDFSGCLHEALGRAYSKFQSLTLGYESTNGSSTIQAFWDVLQYRRSSLYPGEGDRIISLLEEVEHYQYNIEELDDLKNSAEAMMRVIDKVLSNDNSILSQQKLVLLSQLVLRNLGYWSQDHIEPDKHLPLSQVVVNVLPMKLYSSSAVMYSLTIPQDNQNKYPDWYNERVTIRLYHNSAHNVNKTVSGIIVVYRNLAQFFPNAYVTELEDGSDLEYRIGSRIVSVATSQRAASRHERLAIELEFEGALNGSGAWNASCGVLGPDGAWNLDGCSLGEAGGGGAGAVHCLCSSPGTFAAFLTARSEKVTLARNNQTNFVVVLGCGSCLLQCLITALVLTAFWWRNRTWLNFLKIQCCAAVVAAMATFIYAVQADIVEDDLSIVAMCLEAFLLIGTSSPISQALIIYAELSNIHPSRQLQPTVVAVITGVPILAILTTELTRKTIGWKHESWWLIFNSGVYNIFVISSITLLLTFILLYITVIHKTRPLLYKFKRKDIIQLRVRMLHRSALVIFGILAMEISSVFYINSPLIIYHYVFAFQSALLGFIILAMYVMSGEVLVVAPVLHKLKHQAESDDECASAQTKVRSNVRDLEREPSSASSTGPGLATTTVLSAGLQPLPVYPEPRGVAAGIDAREYVTEAAAGAYAAATRLAAPEILIHRVDDVLLEAYGPASRFELVEPARFLLQQQPASTTATGLEGYATMEQRAKPYQELASLTSLPPSADLQQQHQQQHQLQSSLSPGTATSVLCSAQVETCLSSARAPPPVPDVTLAVNGEAELLLKKPLHGLIGPNRPDDLGFEVTSPTATTTTTTAKAMPDITNTMEQRKQPDGEDILLKSKQRHGSLEALDERRPTGFVTNGMLDRISHDLDYLLNRTKESA